MAIFARQKSVREFQESLVKLTDRLDDQQRSIRTLKLEWEETYDKIHRLFGRIAKRTALDAPPPTPPPDSGAVSSDGVDEISAKIHQRRAAGKP